MNDEPVVWYARTDAKDHAWREGGKLVAASLIPAGLILCASAVAGVLIEAFWPALLLVAVAAGYAAWSIVADRRAVVELRVTPGEFTLLRADGTTATYRAREVDRIEVVRVRYVGGSTPNQARLRLRIGKRVERSRPGTDLSTELATAITTAEVDLKVAVKTREE